MSFQFEPLKTADLPPREKAFWQMTGPGAVLVGLSIGAGELVVWPRIAAQYGASMIWAAVVGVFIQLWVNYEIGRWTLATGESAYAGFARMWRGWALAFIGFNIFGWILPGWARTSGSALKALVFGPTHPSPDWFWTAITFGFVALNLFGPKRVYLAMERAISLLVVLIVVGLVLVAFKVGSWETVKETAAGAVNFGHKEPGFPVKDLFVAMVFAGAGGTANLFYSFYLRDKHIGMGARIPALVNPFRQREEKAIETGFAFPDTPENASRFRDWFRFVLLDQTLYFWLLNTFTILLFIFGALAVLHPKGIVPSSGSVIWDEASILSESMGTFGRYLFLVIGLATLYSTQIALTDGVARSLADIITSSFAWGKKLNSPAKLYAVSVWAIMAIGVGLTAFMEYKNVSELGFLFNSAYIGGFGMACYAPLLLWMNLRHLPKCARPKPLNIAMMCIASAIYMGFAIYCLAGEIGKFAK